MLISHQPSAPMLVGASLGGITSLLAVGESDVPLARGIALVDIVPKFEMEGSGPDGCDPVGNGIRHGPDDGQFDRAEVVDDLARRESSSHVGILPHRFRGRRLVSWPHNYSNSRNQPDH